MKLSKANKDSLAIAKSKLFDKLSNDIEAPEVLQVMEIIPRELFVSKSDVHQAYRDIPLDIGYGQTISQPYIVALMTAAMKLEQSHVVLEIGTGSGYQSAILAKILNEGKVISVERIPELADLARSVLNKLNCDNVEIYPATCELGRPSNGPFDAIVVTAACPNLPQALVDQLKVGGRLVVPIGCLKRQELTLVIRTMHGMQGYSLGACRFVPIIGQEGFPESLERSQT